MRHAFNERWGLLCEEGGDDFDEGESFEMLLSEVDACADFSDDFDGEGGPGLSSAFSTYYVKFGEKLDGARSKFGRGADDRSCPE